MDKNKSNVDKTDTAKPEDNKPVNKPDIDVPDNREPDEEPVRSTGKDLVDRYGNTVPGTSVDGNDMKGHVPSQVNKGEAPTRK